MEKQTWQVYILECADQSLYTGITNALTARIQKHQQGKGAKYTAARLPCQLVYTEELDSRSAALKREYAIKQLTRKQKLALIKR